MKAKLILLSIVVVGLGIVFYPILSVAPNQEESDFDKEKAKEAYINAKCNTCHAFSSLEIEAKNKSASNKAPDFSEVKIEYDKEFLRNYVLKKEKINDKLHPVAFKGSDEDLNLIVDLILMESPKPETKPEEENKQE